MRYLLVLLVLCSCSVRRVHKTVTDDSTTDKSVIVTTKTGDSVFHLPGHKIDGSGFIGKPFTVHDTIQSVDVRFDTIRHTVYVTGRVKPIILHLTVHDTVTRYNNIVRTIHTADKQIVKKSLPFWFWIGAVLLGILALLFIFKKL